MPLSTYQAPTESVDLGHGGGALTLRALSTADVFVAFREYKIELAAFYDTIIAMKKAGDFSLEDAPALALSMLENLPLVAGHAIALAAGEPDQKATACALPFPKQLEALEKILGLTFNGVDSVKKMLEALIRYSRGTESLSRMLESTEPSQAPSR